ncbi:hypothetical protein D4R20_00095 [bacterium]|nr:MAG: hypothetical protein D4R20_00095 [bacterium]
MKMCGVDTIKKEGRQSLSISARMGCRIGYQPDFRCEVKAHNPIFTFSPSVKTGFDPGPN